MNDKETKTEKELMTPSEYMHALKELVVKAPEDIVQMNFAFNNPEKNESSPILGMASGNPKHLTLLFMTMVEHDPAFGHILICTAETVKEMFASKCTCEKCTEARKTKATNC